MSRPTVDALDQRVAQLEALLDSDAVGVALPQGLPASQARVPHSAAHRGDGHAHPRRDRQFSREADPGSGWRAEVEPDAAQPARAAVSPSPARDGTPTASAREQWTPQCNPRYRIPSFDGLTSPALSPEVEPPDRCLAATAATAATSAPSPNDAFPVGTGPRGGERPRSEGQSPALGPQSLPAAELRERGAVSGPVGAPAKRVRPAALRPQQRDAQATAAERPLGRDRPSGPLDRDAGDSRSPRKGGGRRHDGARGKADKVQRPLDGHAARDPFPSCPASLWDYLSQELDARTYRRASPEEHGLSVVKNMLLSTLYVEEFIAYGSLVALDALLHHFTILPLRVLQALAQAALSCGRRTAGGFHRAHAYDLLRFAIAAVSVVLLSTVHMSIVYHFIRGQTFIKLYVIFNMLEIFDRMLTAVGQDFADALMFTMRRAPRDLLAVTGFALLMTAYTVVHAALKFVQFVTLNVAINSNNNSLLTLLISNNFVEIKGSVFKRFDNNNLFQIACSDVVERNVSLTFQSVEEFVGVAGFVWVSEIGIDAVKHSFIGKFNRIQPQEYRRFTQVLSRDVTFSRRERDTLDPTHAVCQRLGLPALPLLAVLMRILGLRSYSLWRGLGHGAQLCLVTSIWLLLLFLKALLGRFLVSRALRRDARGTLSPVQSSRVPENLKSLESTKRYTLHRSRVPL